MFEQKDLFPITYPNMSWDAIAKKYALKELVEPLIEEDPIGETNEL